ncbi:MAG: YicC/YloC family endoribonuclease [Bacteroidota bacterium]
MTGFGAANLLTEKWQIKCEIRTLNSKFLDLSYKLPKELSDFELEIKNVLTNQLKRGKVSMSIELEDQTALADQNVAVNEELFKAYFTQYQNMASAVGADPSDLFRLALQSPDVLKTKEPESNKEAGELFLKVLSEAVGKCTGFRKQEGDALSVKLSGYIDKIEERLNQVRLRDPERIKNIKNRIDQNLQEVIGVDKIDSNRFEQEVIYYIEKLDITEEKDRLANHLSFFREILNGKESNGKKLGFVSQEIGREINTIGSKSNDATLQRFVVDMKEELEKIKEQVLNIV